MENKSANTRRIAKNTVFLYARSLFSLFVSLYSSRLILQALGVEDYGTYNVVGGFVSMFWLVSGSLSSAISRFLNFEMGAGNQEQLKRVFSTSLNIMLFLAVIVLFLTETFGLWFFHNKMEIPVGREHASFWVFQFSVLTVMSGFTLVPFNSAIIAHEKMGIFAYLGIAEVLLKLLVALVLAFGNIAFDKLILYALLWLVATLLMQATAAIYCFYNFSECRFRRIFDKPLFKEMFSYAGWNFLGSMAGTFSGQGVNVVLNIFFGTAVNAARGLAGTVNNSVNIFVNNFTLALNPQITKSFAADDRDYLKSLVFRGTKFSYYIMLLFAVPLFLEIDFTLYLWLGEVPAHTANFIRLTLIICLIDLHGGIFNMAQKSTGEIRVLQFWLSLSSFSIFPFSYLALRYGFSPEAIYLISMGVSVINVLIILSIVKKKLQINNKEILNFSYGKMWLISLLSIPAPVSLHFFLQYGWLRFILVIFTSIACTSMAVIACGCSPSERHTLLHHISNWKERFFAK